MGVAHRRVGSDSPCLTLPALSGRHPVLILRFEDIEHSPLARSAVAGLQRRLQVELIESRVKPAPELEAYLGECA